MNTSEHPWMEHDKTGHRAQLPDLPYWRANGWSPCDGPPPEPDLTRNPDSEPDAPPAEGRSASQPKSTAKAAAKTEEN
jgi:hypothetical protein